MARVGQLYKHVKTGHIVQVLHMATLQTAMPSTYLDDMSTMVVYLHGGRIWVRSEAEFDDGRFEEFDLCA